MQIRYKGHAQRRIVGPHVWDKTNHFIQEVTDLNLVAELTTTPDEEFIFVDADDKEKLNRYLTKPAMASKKKREDKPAKTTKQRGG